MEDWVTIRNSKRKNPSMGMRKIAELLGVSRNTVRRALKQETYKGYERQGGVSSLIEPFSESIEERYLDRGEKLSAIIKALRSMSTPI